MHHWKSSRSEGCPTGKQLSVFLDDPHLEIILELTSSMEEEAPGLVGDLGVPYTSDEEMSDLSLNRDWEGGSADSRSPPSRVSSLLLASPPSRALTSGSTISPLRELGSPTI